LSKDTLGSLHEHPVADDDHDQALVAQRCGSSSVPLSGCRKAADKSAATRRIAPSDAGRMAMAARMPAW
jgi:hypothetical protein